ncbi:MAG: MFS transporter [Acidimicrobiales bacterium]
MGPELARYGITLYPVCALGVLGIVDSFQSYAFTVLTPEVSRALGLSLAAIAAARTLQAVALALSPLPVAALSQRRGRRAALCLLTGLAWSLITLLTGFVLSFLALLAVLALDGLSTGSVSALHPPLLVDIYPPTARVRVLSIYQGFVVAGNIVSPLLVGVLAGPFGLTWRGVFLAMGLVSVASTLFALGLRDPEPDRFGPPPEPPATSGPPGLPGTLRAPGAGVVPDEPVSAPELGFFEIVRRLLLIPTIARLSAGYFMIGVLLIPFYTFLSSFLDQRWGLGPATRGLFFAGISLAGIAALVVYGRLAERTFHLDPPRLVEISGLSLLAGVVLLAMGSLAPNFVAMCALFAAGIAGITLLIPGLNAVTQSMVETRQRPHVAAVTGIFLAFGSVLGDIFLASIDRRFGVGGSIVALVVPGVIGALIIRSARAFVNGDLDRMIGEIIEDEDIRSASDRGDRSPMLSCRGLNFSYGSLQVLFDVDFTVDDGEMVALLGTNGAGKSTLLKVISGIGLPRSGTVRLRGSDITYLDPDRRVRLGITQIPGGRAVFGPLEVVENLRAFGYTLGRDRRAVEEAIERCFAAFPPLGQRRHSAAATLSGGEQQMLGLCRALILRPQLLLVDELSLGLAPRVVGELLEMVRRINADGAAIVLVEQSVNIALSLVQHAYFMEKGEIRFDGRARDLLARHDLLRAVFLEGAAAGDPGSRP